MLPIAGCDSYVVSDDCHGRMNLHTRLPEDLPRTDAGNSRQVQNRLSAGSGCQVLLVQHREVELHAMAQMLGALGFRVTKASDSGKALLYFGREPCDLVISELDIPQLNGFQLAQHIRKHSPHTCVLLTTARCQAEVADYMDERLVDGWLFKPFRMDGLRDMLEHAKCSNRQEVG